MLLCLRDALASWTDRDVAAFLLARALGVLDPQLTFQTDAKYVFWTDNKLGASLDQFLRQLADLGALEFDEEREQFRWNAQFSWKELSLKKLSNDPRSSQSDK